MTDDLEVRLANRLRKMIDGMPKDATITISKKTMVGWLMTEGEATRKLSVESHRFANDPNSPDQAEWDEISEGLSDLIMAIMSGDLEILQDTMVDIGVFARGCIPEDVFNFILDLGVKKTWLLEYTSGEAKMASAVDRIVADRYRFANVGDGTKTEKITEGE